MIVSLLPFLRFTNFVKKVYSFPDPNELTTEIESRIVLNFETENPLTFHFSTHHSHFKRNHKVI